MKLLKLNSIWLPVLFVGILLFAGCTQKTKGVDADAIGYQCHQCKFKFYTDKDVWAEFCPSCKASGTPRVAGYICPKDNFITIPPLGENPAPGGTVNCGKCGAATGVLGNPSASELQAWGATKKTRAEVCAK